MICRAPYRAGAESYPCGQCMTCRINRNRLWSHRMMLEQRCHAQSCFVTLSYAPAHLPDGGHLCLRDVQLWFKRLRDRLKPVRVRYFMVGEYGELGGRPHYHVALFGAGPERDHVRNPHFRVRCFCPWCKLMEETWSFGNVDTGELNVRSAAYIGGYVMKKMTNASDPRLCGKPPEFARMSLKPGIGCPAVPSVSASLNSSVGARLIAKLGDVPTSLTHGRKNLPLGRYLRSKLREDLGVDSAQYRETNYAKVRDLCTLHGTVKGSEEAKLLPETQKILNMETRAKIYAKKGNQ
ncbi:replication initiator protein [robinz microvirus RP_35]|nr:replication initiator protein [robinz microvirus RP_35]